MTGSDTRNALELLDKRRLVLAIHDASFPSDDAEEIGRGTPYGIGGMRFVGFAASLGFNGLQLGPQGQTSRGNASPYDSTLFSRSTLSISAHALATDRDWIGLIPPGELERVSARTSTIERDHVAYEIAWDAQRALLATAVERFRRISAGSPIDSVASTDVRRLLAEFESFREREAYWLEPDAVYEFLQRRHGSSSWREWPVAGPDAIDRELYCAGAERAALARDRLSERIANAAIEIQDYAVAQFIAHRQHDRFHQYATDLGVRLFADLQIGLSHRDTWRVQPLFLEGYRLGAPPSRTNPDGQPWGFPIFDPAAYRDARGARTDVMGFLRARVEKLYDEFDGIRIDHPQGLVCPWVYRDDDTDSLHAVQHGARLFESPHRADHPRLAEYAIARATQLAVNAGIPEHADGWVTELDDEQVARYSQLIDIVVEAGRAHGHDPRDIACEILSTLPYPLERVIQRHGLGRFRVTQKADIGDPQNVYRSENARPADWMMLGNHDTPPIRQVIARWKREGAIEAHADYLARRLLPRAGAEQVRRYAKQLSDDEGELLQAQTADMFVSGAQNILLFFADLFGLEEAYNIPGTVASRNWSLRVPHDYAARYPARAREKRAVNLPYVLALALRARSGGSQDSAFTRLASRLEHAADSPQ